MGDFVVQTGFTFGRTLWAIVTRPYEAYRRIVERANTWELAYLIVLVSLYCLSARIQVATVAAMFVVTVGLFWWVGKLVGATGKFSGFVLAWGYTLVPTLVWFWSTSLLYVLIPPPRTTSPEGMVFSVLYLLFSATLLFWKIILSYLALRFGLRLDLKKIIIVSIIVLPLLAIYSIGMYRLGIFRIPFL